MKQRLALCLFTLLAHPLWLAAAAPEGSAVQSKITEVTVYADRARVTRQGSIGLQAGSSSYAFSKLPGWLDEGSVRVGLQPASAGRILDVQVRRNYLAKATDQEFQTAEAAVREIEDQMAELEDERKVLDAQTKHVESIRMFSLEKLPKDMATREVKPEEYGQAVKFIADSLREIAAARRKLDTGKRELQPELAARQKRLEELRKRSQLEETTVSITVDANAAAPVTLTLTYLLPGATWEPVHELRADQNGVSIDLSSYAVVMQTTGEDWADVALTLSTQAATETLKIPELGALLVGRSGPLPRAQRAGADSFKLATKNYEEQNVIWNGLVNPDALFQQEFVQNRGLLLDNAKRVEILFQSLQDRGTTEHFAASSRQTIRSDGRQNRVPIGATTLATTHRILAAPELSLNAIRTVALTNTSAQALLPGKVSIYLGGAFLGFTDNQFVAPGESFSLYLGVADQIKLSRLLDKKRSALKRGGRKTEMSVSFVVTVENLSDKPVQLQLNDRIPTSETDQIRVSSVRIRPETKPDSQGLLRWDVELGPRETSEFRIDYELEYPNEIVQRAQQERVPEAAEPSSVMEQIITLESKF